MYILDGEDFTTNSNETLLFSNSSGKGSDVCYNISILSDGILKADTTISVALSSSDPAVTLQNNYSVVNILEADSKSDKSLKIPMIFIYFYLIVVTNVKYLQLYKINTVAVVIFNNGRFFVVCMVCHDSLYYM